ncbi:MAG: hypothetical protein NC184_07370 [Roseburia sp.]|nr:hypothetical protein [Roseburia sp.]
MENVRYNISPCSAEEAEKFVSKIDGASFVPNGTVKANERSHYDRYSYICDNCRVAVVYDTSACILSITGRRDHAKTLLDVFAPENKIVKSSTVPAQNSSHGDEQTQLDPPPLVSTGNGKRSKIFVQPDSIRRRPVITPMPTIIATSRGAELSTEEIYPPQRGSRLREREQQRADGRDRDSSRFEAESGYDFHDGRKGFDERAHDDNEGIYPPPPKYGVSEFSRNAQGAVTRRDTDSGINVSVSAPPRSTDAPRRTTISFGDEDYSAPRGDRNDFKVNTRARTGSERYGVPDVSAPPPPDEPPPEPIKRKRGRPRKTDDRAQNDLVPPPEVDYGGRAVPGYQNGYAIKNYRKEALVQALKRLKADGKTVSADGTEFDGTPQEIKLFSVSDEHGQKVILRYATNRMTLQLQGKRCALFGDVQSQVSSDSDYSSAIEGYAETAESGAATGKKLATEVQARLKRRLPTAMEFLSEPSCIDFSYGILDFGQAGLRLSDYSGLLVPAFRGLERFIFDLQRVEGINVKMIGQAYDKDDSGKYVLKSGYRQRIGSVVYSEVMVALYTEYFSQRNYFSHSDNTNGNISRSISDRAVAKGIFDHMLDVVEYNSKKLKEIGFSATQGVQRRR